MSQILLEQFRDLENCIYCFKGKKKYAKIGQLENLHLNLSSAPYQTHYLERGSPPLWDAMRLSPETRVKTPPALPCPTRWGENQRPIDREAPDTHAFQMKHRVSESVLSFSKWHTQLRGTASDWEGLAHSSCHRDRRRPWPHTLSQAAGRSGGEAGKRVFFANCFPKRWSVLLSKRRCVACFALQGWPPRSGTWLH